MGGEILKGLGLALLALGSRFLALAVAAQIVNACGFSMAATADPLVATRLVDGDPDGMARMQSSTQSLMFLAVLVSGIAGALLYGHGSSLPLLAGAGAAGLAACVMLDLNRKLIAAATTEPRVVKGAVNSAGSLLPEERAWVSYYVLTRGFMLAAFVGLLPFLLYRVVRVSVVGLALCLGAFSLAAFVTARYIRWVLDRLGPRRFALLTVIVLVGAFSVFAASRTLWSIVAAMALMGCASGGVRPATLSRLTAVAKEVREGPIPPWLVPNMERSFGLCNAIVILGGGLIIARASFAAAMVAVIGTYLILNLAQLAATARSGRRAKQAHAGHRGTSG